MQNVLPLCAETEREEQVGRPRDLCCCDDRFKIGPNEAPAFPLGVFSLPSEVGSDRGLGFSGYPPVRMLYAIASKRSITFKGRKGARGRGNLLLNNSVHGHKSHTSTHECFRKPNNKSEDGRWFQFLLASPHAIGVPKIFSTWLIILQP